MKQELENQLEWLKSLGVSEDSHEYKKAKAAMKEFDKIPKKDWNKKTK